MSQLQVTGEAKIRDIQGPVVANSGVITALDGDASQYVRGDGTLADFPTSTGGGSSVSYYLNSSVSQGTIGGVAYRQLGKTPIAGAGTDITASTNGYIASYITDANDPALLEVPAGNFNCEFYFSVNSNNHDPYVYAEVYKYDGTNFTLIGSSQSVPEYLTNGTTLSPYYFAIPVSQTVLSITDRIAIRIYVNVDGRVVTLHTENNHLCQVVTTFSKGLTSLNNLTRQVQFLTTGTSGTDFNISSSVATHTFNLPIASATNTGKLSSTDWTTFNNKQPAGNYVTLDTTQTITGAKTFSSVITGDAGISLKEGVVPSGVGYTGLAGDADGLVITKRVGATAYTNLLSFTTSTSNTYSFPNASGTIVLSSDLSGYVPYSGATMGLDLGTYSYNGNSVVINGNNTTQNGTLLFKQVGGLAFNSTGYSGIGILGTTAIHFNFNQSSGVYKQFNFDVTGLTNNTLRTLTIPNATGTIALTSDLSGYVPYTGATNDVDLGARYFKATGVQTESAFALKILTAGIAFQNGYSVMSSLAGTFSITQAVSAGNLKSMTLDFSAWSTNTSYTYALPAANGTIALTSNFANYVSLDGNQTIIGIKTFNNDTIFNGAVDVNNSINLNSGVFFRNNAVGSTLYTNFSILKSGSLETLTYLFTTANSSKLVFNDAANYTYTFPTTSGTLALSSDLSSYVPYTGATSGVNLGVYQLTAAGINVMGNGSNAGQVFLKQGAGFSLSTGYASIGSDTSNGFYFYQTVSSVSRGAVLSLSSITAAATRTYTLPDANGTLVLGTGTTNYLPKFTGASTIGDSLLYSSTTGIGIGTTSPNVLLEVKGGTAMTSLANSYTNAGFIHQYNSTNILSLGSNGSGMIIQGVNAGTNGAVQLLLQPFGGNVGIGTSTPSARLDVRVPVESPATGAVALIAGTSNGANDIFRWFDGTTQLGVIKNSGNVGIGTSSPMPWGGSFLGLSVGQASVGCLPNSANAYFTNNLYYDGSFRRGIAAPVASLIMNEDRIAISNAATGTAASVATMNERFVIFASGNVRFSSQVYNNTVASPRTLYIASDGELGGISSIRESKTNIAELDSNWLMQLNPVSFNYRKKDEDGKYTDEYYDELFYGLIAEETELVNKEICTYNDDKLVGIEYSKLVPVLVKAIQELNAKVSALENKS